MGLSKAEVKLRRLLASMPSQENSRKLVHYVATARELLTALTGESAHQNLPSISSEKAREYGQKIEEFAEKINIVQMADMWDALKASSSPADTEIIDDNDSTIDSSSVPESNLRKRRHRQEDPAPGPSQELKLDSATHEFIGKHRRLQDDLTDEMVAFARHMKESTLLMQQTLQDSDKAVDATGEAVERSLASTFRATRRAAELYTRGSSTGCYTWLLIFVMFCVFFFMIALIRIT